MDVTTLAKNLVVFLTPFLPYLLKAGEKAAEETGKKLGVMPGTEQKVYGQNCARK